MRCAEIMAPVNERVSPPVRAVVETYPRWNAEGVYRKWGKQVSPGADTLSFWVWHHADRSVVVCCGGNSIPNYTSEEAPRSVLSGLEQKVIEKVDWEPWMRVLWAVVWIGRFLGGRPTLEDALGQFDACQNGGPAMSAEDVLNFAGPRFGASDLIMVATATAEQRARACCLCMQEEGK